MAMQKSYEALGKKIKDLEDEIARFKSMANALRESEKKFRNLVEVTSDLIWEIDLEGTYTYVDSRIKDLLGYDEVEVVGKTLFDFMSEKEATRTRKIVTQKNQDPVSFSEGRITHLHKEGHPVIVEINAAPIIDRGGKLSGWYGFSRDVTHRKPAEETTRESEAKLKSFFDNVNDLIVYLDRDGTIVDVNRKVEDIFGYKPEELINKNFFRIDFSNKENKEKAAMLFKDLVAGMPPDLMKLKTKRKDGAEIHIEISSAVTKKDGEVQNIFCIIRDITRRKKLEVQLQQARRMEAIGTLAGGIAHEFNNAIIAVTGNIELLQMDLPDDEYVRRYCESMKASAHRMTQLTNQLLAYAGGGKYRASILSLNDFVEDTRSLLKHTIDPSIRVETDLSGDRLDINADLTQMQMVFSAVLANAAEAIEHKGKIRISTKKIEPSEKYEKNTTNLKPGPHVCLTIEDDGKGMAEHIRAKIFEPFFSTKFQGRGLGMAAVYGIIRNHDGSIIVDSEPGKGTKVRIYLPSADIETGRADSPSAGLTIGSGTILIIEDEEIVMDVTAAMLEKLGYNLLKAKTGKQALHISKNFDGHIDLALLDIKLPDMDGIKLHSLIKKACPDLKVIVCSGYPLDGPAQKIIDAGADDFIQKPFSFKILSDKLKRLLDT